MQKRFLSSFVTLALCALSAGAQAMDISGAVGTTGQQGFTGRIGLGFEWAKNWLQSDTGHLTGYWDTGLTHWESGKRAASRTSISFAPVFVYEFNTSSIITPFIEAGVGVSLFSGSRVGDRTLGSSFNFEDRLGVGLKFANQDRVGLRVIHYSNAGIKQPNNGIESYSLFYRHAF
ncbi:acyloxyacyl hydrolase [Pantoea sp. Tr-811]|uniref:acyloxyacyl hydrolase n=1 Tax=Pantoea sp. Tr-811 TaxID=2608361 RepID=UPI001423B31E|nr:acyloxyacyl hydrolase [Pantoea sp. Tr-811]NIF28920.1 acyloxyacyl hydrolase [Pantoea sp. Tr-811]